MQYAESPSVEDRAADLVDHIDLLGFVLTYSAALYLCRQLPSWGSAGPERLRKSFAAVGITLTSEQALEAFARAIAQPCEPDPEAEADWEILLTHPEHRPEARRLRGAFFEARKTFVTLVERGIAPLRPFPWGMLKPTTAGLTVLFDHTAASPAARLRCLTQPLPSRLLAEHRQHLAESLRRSFEEKHRGWLDGVAALSANASTAELFLHGFQRETGDGPCVESRVLALLELRAGSRSRESRDAAPELKLYIQRDTGKALLTSPQLDALKARYQHFVEARPANRFSSLWSQVAKELRG
jgi:hypothetical protein